MAVREAHFKCIDCNCLTLALYSIRMQTTNKTLTRKKKKILSHSIGTARRHVNNLLFGAINSSSSSSTFARFDANASPFDRNRLVCLQFTVNFPIFFSFRHALLHSFTCRQKRWCAGGKRRKEKTETICFCAHTHTHSQIFARTNSNLFGQSITLKLNEEMPTVVVVAVVVVVDVDSTQSKSCLHKRCVHTPTIAIHYRLRCIYSK